MDVDVGDVVVDMDELLDEPALDVWRTVAEGAALTARLKGNVMFPGVPSVGAAGSTMENSGLWLAAFPVTGAHSYRHLLHLDDGSRDARTGNPVEAAGGHRRHYHIHDLVCEGKAVGEWLA